MNDFVEKINDTFTSAAVYKASEVSNPFRKHVRITFVDFCEAHYRHQRDVRDPEFWTKPEKERDAHHAGFCRAYVLMNVANDGQEEIAARMFKKLREVFINESCRLTREALNAAMAEQGYEDQGIGPDGIRRHVRKSPIELTVK
jgi:hypothetical protein